MISKFEKKVLTFIRRYDLLPNNGNILIAVSGGADSIALMHVLWALKAQGKINNDFICVHLNHKLRGEHSDGDEDFAASQAANLQIKCLRCKYDIKEYARRKKLSLETAGRQWRIETLQQTAQKHNCLLIATGHHKDDNAETIIQRMLRGTGFRGLGGIWPKRTFDNGITFVRPLLCVSRNEIHDYLKHRCITWRTDVTNAHLEFKRNFIRHKLIPYLQKDCSQPLAEQLSTLANSAQKLNKKLQRQSECLWQKLADAGPDRVTFDLAAFNAQGEPVKTELIRQSLLWLGSGEKNLTEQHYISVLDLTKQNVSNRILELPDGFSAWREYKRLIFARLQKLDNKERITSKTIEITIGGKTFFGNYTIDSQIQNAVPSLVEALTQNKDHRTECFDLEKLLLPLKVRFRIEGDKFWPLGAGGEKKVGQFLTNEKVPRDIRNKVLIVSDSEKIVWVWPMRISEKVKVTDQTSKILQLKIM